MPEGARYEVLHDEEENTVEIQSGNSPSREPLISSTTTEEQNASSPLPPPDESPPPYTPNPDNTTPVSVELNLETTGESPPCYSDVVKLPTYEELEEHQRDEVIRNYFDLSTNNEEENDGEVKVGTDFSFVLCFVVSFLLNWIGFLAGYCFGGTLAAKYGALSGFGLSLIKWAFLIKNSDCCTDTFHEYPWIIWLFVIIGWLVFVRGALAYLHLKRLIRGREFGIRVWSW